MTEETKALPSVELVAAPADAPLTAEQIAVVADEFADYFDRRASIGTGVCTAGGGSSVLVAWHADLAPDGDHRQPQKTILELMEDAKTVPVRLHLEKLRAVCRVNIKSGYDAYREAEEKFEKECKARHFYSDTECPCCGERIIVPEMGDTPIGYDNWYDDNKPSEDSFAPSVWVRFAEGDASVSIPYSPLLLANILGAEKRLGGIVKCATLKMEQPHHVLVFIGKDWRACVVPRAGVPRPDSLSPADEVEATEGGEP